MSDDSAIRYARGRDRFDANPVIREARDFDEFAEHVLRDRAKVKGMQYITAPMRVNGDGRPHRGKDFVEVRRFLALDVDHIAGPNVNVDLRMWLARFKGFGFTTASSTADAPRCRVVLALDRDVDRTEGMRLGAAIQRDIAEEFGDRVKLDPSTHRGEQPCYGPVTHSEAFHLDGDPIEVDAWLETAPVIEPDRRGSASIAPGDDPVIARLKETGMYRRDLGGGKHAIRCFGESEHSTEDDDNSSATCYFQPHYGGYLTPGFKCQHAHCAKRTGDDLLEFLGLDWRTVRDAYKRPEQPQDTQQEPPVWLDDVQPAEGEAESTTSTKRRTATPAVIYGRERNVLIEITQDSMAEIFAEQHEADLRYDCDQGCWVRNEGNRWARESTGFAFDAMRHMVRALNKDNRKEFARAAFVEGAEKFARTDRRLVITSAQWDRDPMLLNTPGGVVDLRTGEMRPTDPADLLTKLTSVAPRQGRPSPVWSEFLKQATQGDDELIGFLQRMAGYALTADTREECLFFVYGPGGNGKGVFIGALFNVLADYAQNAAMDTFLASKAERHPTDLAMLRGARLVTASETTEGRAWDEQRLKAMTGNDPITARFMRQDFFTFIPAFKLILLGNNKPILRSVDDAWRRRFNVIPFTHKPAKKDPTLKGRLRAEYPEILHWMIEGCLDWQRNGLQPPQRVLSETSAYFESQDVFQTWLDDCIEADPRKATTTAELFRSWSLYCERHHEPAGTSRSFGDRLASRGFRRIKDEHGVRGRGFLGLSVIEFSHLEVPN